MKLSKWCTWFIADDLKNVSVSDRSARGKWSTNAVETATEFLGPMAAFAIGAVIGFMVALALVARHLPELCAEHAEPVLAPSRPSTP